MNRKRFFALFLLVVLLTVFISGCAGVSRIDSFFANQEFKQHAKLIDFGLFFVIFFAMSYLGLTKVWGEGYGKGGSGKGAIVGLCLALALALAFAIVTQTSFSITTIFPLAKALFFLIITFILAGLIIHSKMFGEGKMAKFIAVVIALIATYLIFSIATHMICQMSDNMDDPACKSDFFNAFFNLLGRFFGIESWTLGDGTPSAPGEPGTKKPPPKPIPIPPGPPKGGCRMDITFAVNKHDIFTSSMDFDEYAKRVKANWSKVYVYGFASEEGPEKRNIWLARNRAKKIKTMLEGLGLKATHYAKSARTLFGTGNASRPKNRRVVITTSPLSGRNFLPAPSPGSIVGCPPAVDQKCGNDKIEGTEECDGSNAPKCPGKCIAPGKKDECKCQPKDKDKDKDKEKDDNSKWLWLLLIIPLLILWLLVRRKVRVKVEDALAMKDVYYKRLKKIASEKELAWHNIVVVAADADTMGETEVKGKAQETIDMLNKELEDKGWVTIRKLAFRYGKSLNRIIRDAKNFKIDEKHAKLIVKMLHDLARKHAPKKILTRKLLRAWDKALFYSRLREVLAEIIHGNKTFKEFHLFFNLQNELRKYTEEFGRKEEKILVSLRKMHSSTLFGKHRYVTKHFTRQASGFPWLKKEVEGKLEEHFVDPSSRYGLVEVTQEVRNLCAELIAKIQEVLDEEQNVTHHEGSMAEFKRKYEEEKDIIARLLAAIQTQKKIMSEEWCPVIDHVDIGQGSMEGHVHYRRY